VSKLTSAAPSRLTFPLSPQYTTWTVRDALREIIANALDEDARAHVAWDDTRQALTVEDQGAGVPRRGLVLGVSVDNRTGERKSDDQIGVFGEGLKIGALVMVRNQIPMRVETVGYTFTPTLVHDPNLDCEVLALDFENTDRATGTRAVIHCTHEQAQDAMSLFRHLTVPDYQPPEFPGEIIVSDDGTPAPGGNVYIGGLLVSTGQPLKFSYDLSLDHKRAQNRDRTVISGPQLHAACRDILSWTDNEHVIETWLEAMLAGQLSDCERAFTIAHPDVQAAFTAVGERMFSGRIVCFSAAPDDAEASMDARDRGYEILTPQNIPTSTFTEVMRAVGIPAARNLFQRPRQTITAWVRRSQLTAAETRTLDTAVDLIRRAFGHAAVDRVDAYENTRYEFADEDLHFGGFYQSGDGRIGVQRRNLQSLFSTIEVLLHETAHRIRHRVQGEPDFQDRTRGFESTLTHMMAVLMQTLHESGSLPELTAAERTPAVEALHVNRPRQRQLGASGHDPHAVDLDVDSLWRQALGRHKAHPCHMATALVQSAMVRCGMAATNAEGLGMLAGSSAASARKFCGFSLRGPSRSSSGRAVGIESAQAVAEVLDLPWGVLYLAFQTAQLPDAARTNAGVLRRAGDWREALAALDADGAPSDTLTAIGEIVSGQERCQGDPAEWMAPFVALLEWQRQRTAEQAAV
jgi:hypothetical protein